MYIQFRLPSGLSKNSAAQHVNAILNRQLHDWADKHGVAYNKKVVKWTVRITFDDERHYTLFAMTWNPQGKYRDWLNYEFIEPMNIDKTR